MLIRFMHLHTTARLALHRETRMLPLARVQLGVGGRLRVGSDAQQRPEGVERVEAPVKAEGELVQVCLEMLRADAVVAAQQPRLQVAEHEVDQRQPLLGYGGIAVLRDRLVLEVVLLERTIGGPVVCGDVRARSDGHGSEAHETVGGWAGNDSQPQAPSFPPAAPGECLGLHSEDVLFGLRPLALANLDGSNDKRLVVGALPLAACPAADPGLVQFDRVDATDHVHVATDHARAQLVQDLEGRFVPLEAELALELHGRDAWGQAGDEVRAPEPRQQRRVAVLHDGAGCQPRLFLALLTAQDVWSGGDAPWLAGRLAARADEAVGPADALHVDGARGIVRKEPLELRETLGEWEIGGPLLYVHSQNVSP